MAKGQKTCTKCNAVCGCRSLQCPSCGNSFDITKKEKLPKEVSPLDRTKVDSSSKRRPHGNFRLIFVPGQSNPDLPFCPIEPKNDSKETMKLWAERLRDYTGKSGPTCERRYSRHAIKCFVDVFWPEDSKPELYNQAIKIVESIMEPYPEELTQGYN